jgi:hypothetical protein
MGQFQDIFNKYKSSDDTVSHQIAYQVMFEVFGNILTYPIFDRNCDAEILTYSDMKTLFVRLDKYFETCPIEDLGIQTSRGRSPGRGNALARSISRKFKQVFSKAPRKESHATHEIRPPNLAYMPLSPESPPVTKVELPVVVVDEDTSHFRVPVPSTPNKTQDGVREDIAELRALMSRLEVLLLEMHENQKAILDKLST